MKPAHRPSTPVIEQEINGKVRETITRTVKQQGSSGGVYVPKTWIGDEVMIVRLS